MDFSCFVSWGTETTANCPKSPPFLDAKSLGEFEEKLTKAFLEGRQSNRPLQDQPQENHLGALLVELLSSNDNCQTWKPTVALPATKQRRDEEPTQSLSRLVESRLQPMEGCFANAKASRRVEI